MHREKNKFSKEQKPFITNIVQIISSLAALIMNHNI